MAMKQPKKKPLLKKDQVGVPEDSSAPENRRKYPKKPPKKKRAPLNDSIAVPEEKLVETEQSRIDQHPKKFKRDFFKEDVENDTVNSSDQGSGGSNETESSETDKNNKIPEIDFAIEYDLGLVPEFDEDGDPVLYKTDLPGIYQDCHGRHFNEILNPLFYWYRDDQIFATSLGECWTKEGKRLVNNDKYLQPSKKNVHSDSNMSNDEVKKKSGKSDSESEESASQTVGRDEISEIVNNEETVQTETDAAPPRNDDGDGKGIENSKTSSTDITSDVVLFSEKEIRHFFSNRKIIGKGSKSLIRSIKNAKKTLRKVILNEHDIVELNRIVFDLIAEFNGSAPQIFKNHNDDIIIVMTKNRKVVIEVMSKHRFRFFCHRLARFIIIKGDGSEKNSMVSFDIISDVMETPDKPLLTLERVVQYPLFDQNKVLTISPGYNPESQIFFDMDETIAFPEISKAPNDYEIRLARYIIDEYLFNGFQFASKADYANAFSLFLLFFVLDIVDGPTPLHVVESAEYGSGKTYLIRCIIYSIGGMIYRESTLPNSEAELRRQLFAELLLLNPYMLFENLNEHVTVDSAELAQALTGVSKSGRLLGKSQIIDLKLKLIWISTGINVSLSKELKRRSIQIKLIKPDSFPDEDRLAIVKENRDKILWAGLTICQAHFSQGCEKGRRLLPSFNRWSSLMDGILKTAGVKGFLDNQEAFMNAADPEFDSQVEFVTAWHRIFGTRKVLSRDLIRLISDEKLSIQIEGRSDVQKAVNLGFLLRRVKGRRFGRHTIKDAGTRSGSRLWCLIETI
jgi:hypothetical protein